MAFNRYWRRVAFGLGVVVLVTCLSCRVSRNRAVATIDVQVSDQVNGATVSFAGTLTTNNEVSALDDQWMRIRIALNLLGTFVSESGYRQYRKQYREIEGPLMRDFECPPPPDWPLSKEFRGVGPCPKFPQGVLDKLFKIEEKHRRGAGKTPQP